MWVAITQAVEDLNRAKSLGRRDFFLTNFFKLGHWSLPAFGHRLGLELTPRLSWVSSLLTTALGTTQPP